jgi:hypothetical protein
MTPEVVETACEWSAEDVQDSQQWTEVLTTSELKELDEAIAYARSRSDNFLDISKHEFPLPTLAARLRRIENDLINGRGFVLIRGLPRERYDNDEMCLAYWGIGAHLGKPWAQNHYGHLLGDVTDQGKRPEDPDSRGNEMGQIGLDYHCDGSDLVGLLCLRSPASGGLSAVCNSVTLHNRLVRERPELAAELYNPQPYDMRGEHKPGSRAWYTVPVFTRWNDRIFIRLIGYYIMASQKHADAPRLTERAIEALKWMRHEAQSNRHSVLMDFQPGDMQFINNYHVLHGRTPYQDDRARGLVRHLKRLWLETEVLTDRPPHFRNGHRSHWNEKRVISRLDAAS